jgi:hypothetical protein
MRVLAYRSAEALHGPADPVLDRVLVQHQAFGGRLVAALQLQEAGRVSRSRAWLSSSVARPPAWRAPRPAAVLASARIGRDDLLRGPVHVPGHDRRHAECRGGQHLRVVCLPGQLLEQPVGEAGVPEPVGAQQRGERRAALRPVPRVIPRTRPGPARRSTAVTASCSFALMRKVTPSCLLAWQATVVTVDRFAPLLRRERCRRS